MPDLVKSLPGYQPVAVVRFAMDGKILQANGQAGEIFGYTGEELLGLRIHDIHPLTKEEDWKDNLRELRVDGTAKFLRQLRRKDGSVFPAMVIGHLVGSGRDESVIGFINDISEDVRTEQSLRKSEEQLRLALMAANHGLYDVDFRTEEVKVSPEYAKMLGHDPSRFRLTIDSWIGMLHPEERDSVVKSFEACLRGDLPLFTLEFRQRTLSGAYKWMLSVGKIVERDAAGRPVRMVGTHTDITGQKETEEALRESEYFLRKSQEVAGLGSFTLDLASGEWTCSAVLDDIFGIGDRYKKDVESWAALISPDQREGMLVEHKRAVIEHGKRFDMEYRIIRPSDGEERWLHDVSELEYDGDGKPVRMIGMIRDITERKRAEEVLRQSELTLRRSQEVARLFSFAVDLASNKWTGSDISKEILGIDDEYPGDFNGWKGLVHPDDWEGLMSSWDQFVVGGSNRYDMEFRILRKADGRERWLRSLGEMEFDGQGAPVRVVGMTMDITERKLKEKEKAELEEVLLQSRKLETVGRLAGGVAHEFNNMLCVILGYAELMRNRLPGGDPMLKFLAEIEKAGGRSRDITNQLLAFSRKQVIAPEVVDLNDLLARVEKTLGRLIGDEIRLGFFPGEGIWSVLVDPAQMDQLLMNLAVNARDAMPDGGRMTIATSNARIDEGQGRHGLPVVPGDYVCLAVTDEGVGMDRETLSHVFEPFFTTKDLGKGTGLGLPTVYGIVRQNGGFIEAESAPGKGTTFRIYLPRRAEGADAAETPCPAGETAAAGSPGSILLVEDDEMVRNMAVRMLENLGYKVSCTGSPFEALDLCGKPDFPADLLITDVAMPGMNGGELWEKAKAVRPGMGILFMSGCPSEEIADRGILDEGGCFLNKPFTRKGLARAVAEALAARRAGEGNA